MPTDLQRIWTIKTPLIWKKGFNTDGMKPQKGLISAFLATT